MFASGAGALVATFMTLANATVVGEARLQARVGEIPGMPGPQVSTTAMPGVSLSWFDSQNQLQLQLGSRILWRPVDRPRDRPLFLETFSLSHSTHPSRRVQWRSEIQGSYGEQDYMSLSQALANQPTLPFASTMLMVGGSTGPSWVVSRRSALKCLLNVTHRRTFDSSTGGSETPGASFRMPTQIVLGVSPALGYQLKPGASLTFTVPVYDYDSQAFSGPPSSGAPSSGGQTNTLTIQPQVSLAERLSRVHQLQLSAGATYYEVLRGPNTSQGRAVSPLGQIGLASDFYRTSSFGLKSLVSASIARYMDPILGIGTLRGEATAGLSMQMDRRWSCELRAVFATDLSKPPASNPQQNSMVVSVDSTLRYRWPNLMALELGGRFSDRATDPMSSRFAWRGRELWFFLSFYAAATASLGSVHPPANPVGK
jgi:hypothetical protein